MAENLYRITDFSGGLQTKVSRFLLPDRELDKVVNAELDQLGALTKRDGYTRLGQAITTLPILGLAQLAKSNGENHYLAFTNLGVPTATVLQNCDTHTDWTTSDATNFTKSQETSIKQEGTGSVKVVASANTSSVKSFAAITNPSTTHKAYYQYSATALPAPATFTTEVSTANYTGIGTDDTDYETFTTTPSTGPDTDITTPSTPVTSSHTPYTGYTLAATVDDSAIVGCVWILPPQTLVICQWDFGSIQPINRLKIRGYDDKPTNLQAIEVSEDEQYWTSLWTGNTQYTGPWWELELPITNAKYGRVKILPTTGGTSCIFEVEWRLAGNYYTSPTYSHVEGDIDLSAHSVAAITQLTPKTIAYGSGNGGAGLSFFIYNFTTSTWDSIGTNVAVVGDSDATKTITSDITSGISNYVSGQRAKLLVRSTNPSTSPAGTTGAAITVDLLNLTVYSGALNATISATIASSDISKKDSVKFYVRSTRTGTFLQAQMGEAAASENSYDITISAADTWEQKTWDISAIPAASRNAITKLAVKCINANETFTFYLDDINAYGETTDIYKYQNSVWNLTGQSLDGTSRVAVKPFMDYLFIVNDSDDTQTYDGSTLSSTLNVRRAPNAKYIEEFNNIIYLQNNSDHKSRTWHSSSPMDLITTIKGAQSGSLTSVTVASTKYLVPNMIIDIYTANTTTKIGDSITITGITSSTTFSIGSTTLTLAHGDEIYLEDKKGTLVLLWDALDETGHKAEDYFDVAKDDGDEGTGLKTNGNKLLVFKEHSTYYYDETQLQPISKTIGCIAPRSITNLGSPELTYFLSEDGVYACDGTAVYKISRPVQTYIDAIDKTGLANLCAGTDGDHYYLFIGSLSSLGLTNVMLDYDTALKSWAVHILHHAPRLMTNYIINDNQNLYWGTANSYVHQWDSGTSDDGSVLPLEAVKSSFLGDPESLKQLTKVIIWTKDAKGTAVLVTTDENEYKSVGDITSRRTVFKPTGLSGYEYHFKFLQAGSDKPRIEAISCYYTVVGSE